jgi:signal transduction histidine kinase/putative methionine-R-sulfoxide reductase with GAF domain
MSRSPHSNRIRSQILQNLVLAYLGLALVVFGAIPFLAYNWLKAPFLGVFLEQTLVVNLAHPDGANAFWTRSGQSPEFGYQLIQVNNTPVKNSAGIQAALMETPSGQDISLSLLTPNGKTLEFSLQPISFSSRNLLTYLYLPYLVGLVFLGAGLWIFTVRRAEPTGRAFVILSASLAILSAGLFDLYTSHSLAYLWTLAAGLAGGALFDLALLFPQESRTIQRFPWLRLLGYLNALVLVGFAFPTLFNFELPTRYALAWQNLYAFSAASFLLFLGMMIYRNQTSLSPIIKYETRSILLGMLISFGPLAIWLILSIFRPTPFSPFFFIPTAIFPVVTGFSILRSRLMQTDFLLRQGILYASLSVLAIAGYALLVSGLSLILGGTISANDPLLVGTLVFVLAVCLNPVRNRLQHTIDNLFFRGERAYQQRVQDFTHELTSIVELNGIILSLRRKIQESLQPDQLHIFILDLLNDQYVASTGEDKRLTSDIHFSLTSPLVQTLKRQNLPLFIDRINLSNTLQPEQARLALLGTHLFIPLPGGERLLGWLALGSRHSGQNYSSQDLDFLTLLAEQAAVAIERAQVVFNMEKRVREMNILSRVAQGVNVTVAFDDILELIYAQTDQVIQVDDLHITLYNKENDYYYFAFCLESDERLPERENMPLPIDQGLNPVVIIERHTLMTADYARECLQRGVKPSASGLYAWAGVPLNAGAETIGALSVGSQDASVVYTQGQVELLQAIADQAAGAIVKAHLLQESERRARQLSSLNEITRQLSSTLETEPLLKNILNSAVGILNCEAGSLFLVDDQTDELVFAVTVGPVADNLIGQRLPPGTGIVGKAVQTRQPVISNNVRTARNWNPAPDEETGFISKTILAVPLQVKDSVIGVLEVINRSDGLPFVEDDQNLLAAFASQAAVAIENARLYTLTDQELNIRVEELSVMQRIDRELNASLDMTRAMRLTLDWAMRQSAAEAGLIGVLSEAGLGIIAQQGFDELSQKYKETPMALDQATLRSAVESGQPQQVVLQADQAGLLPTSRSQTAIPIRREANVIGLILLESSRPETQTADALAFLTRLSDHAAIAIANAQLYSAVEAANNAKSEFVSFVAHEIKNPMTSIKGYSELLAAGAVGPINEMQANFLHTIRSNVERMSTLVTDLNDNSKIEAGRLRLDFKAVDLVDVMDETVRSSTRQCEDKKQTIEVALADNLPKVWADRTRLSQVLINLVSNANKYTQEGGKIIMAAERAKNQWDASGAQEVVHIWVKDNGIGISLEDQKKIFQKFFRSEDQKAREATGTGLGLNITRSLVEMQGGTIWFESEFRQGTTFHFTVPVTES